VAKGEIIVLVIQHSLFTIHHSAKPTVAKGEIIVLAHRVNRSLPCGTKSFTRRDSSPYTSKAGLTLLNELTAALPQLLNSKLRFS
jgi:hypothetical protein